MMDTTVYTMPDGAYIQRVDRRTARKLYDAGAPIWLQACRLHPAGAWTQAVQIERNDADGATFEQVENAFMYYNCTPETGKRVAWYARPMLSHDSNDMPAYCAYGKHRNGHVYRLDKPLTDAQRVTLAKYRSVKIMHGASEFAPEIKYDAIWLEDR